MSRRITPTPPRSRSPEASHGRQAAPAPPPESYIEGVLRRAEWINDRLVALFLWATRPFAPCVARILASPVWAWLAVRIERAWDIVSGRWVAVSKWVAGTWVWVHTVVPRAVVRFYLWIWRVRIFYITVLFLALSCGAGAQRALARLDRADVFDRRPLVFRI